MNQTQTYPIFSFFAKFKSNIVQKMLHLGSVYFLHGVFKTITVAASTSLFIQQYGTQAFSSANMYLALGGFVFMILTSLFTDLMKKVYYFITIHTFILVLWLLMIFFFSNPMVPAFFYGVAFAIDISFLLQRFNVADETCTVFESRSIYPNLPIFYSIGVVSSGFIVSKFGTFFTGINALIVSSVILLLLIGVVITIRLRHNDLYIQRDKQQIKKVAPPPYKKIIGMIFANKVVQIISVLVVISFFAQYYISYLLSTELKRALSPSEITSFLGSVSYIRHSAVILANIFLMRFLHNKYGSVYLGLFKPLLALVMMIPYLAYPHYLTMAAIMITYEGGETAFFVLSRRFSYNVFPRNIIGRLSLIMEGSVAMIGILLSGIAIYYFKPTFNPYILILPAILVLIYWLYLHSKLRQCHLKNLLKNTKGSDKELQYQSIDALIEKPNQKEASADMRKQLKHVKDEETMERMYFALAKLADKNTLPFFISTLHDPNVSDPVKQIIYKNLNCFAYILQHAHITRHNLIDISQKLLLETKNNYFKEVIIESLSQADFIEIVPLLMKNLESDNTLVRLNSIRALGFFHDIGIVHTLDRFLKQGSPEEKEKCVLALWQFPEQRPFLFPIISQLMYASDTIALMSGIDLIGNLKLYWEDKFLLEHVKSNNIEVSRHAALALTMLEQEAGISLYLDTLTTDNALKFDALTILNTVPEDFRNSIFDALALLSNDRISVAISLLQKTGSSYYNEIDALEQGMQPAT